MSQSDYLIAFYSIVMGLTATKYLQGWGDLIKDRRINQNYFVTIVWSLAFFLSIINEWIIQFNVWPSRHSILDLLTALIIPFGFYIIGVLIFPSELGEQTDENYFTHFLQQKKFIVGIALAILFIKLDLFQLNMTQNLAVRKEILLACLPHIVVLFTKNRWVILGCGLFILLLWGIRMEGF